MGNNRSQVMSAFIKAIRLRRTTEAVYWMMALRQHTNDYHIIRRILIASGEDGVSAPVMEKASNLHSAYKTAAPVNMAAEVVRLCSTPCWWSLPQGYDYMRGWRQAMKRNVMKGRQAGTMMEALDSALTSKDHDAACDAMLHLKGAPGFDPVDLIKLLRGYATGNKEANWKLDIYEGNLRVLATDDNFTGQVMYCILKGTMGFNDQVVVMRGPVVEIMNKAMKSSAMDVPEYYLDGIHVSGGDRRFAGTVPAMFGMCKAFKQFGRLDPEDVWPGEFWSSAA